MHRRHPAAIVMEVDFNGPGEGLRLAEQVQLGLEPKLPMLFFSHAETDTPTRLAAVRAGGLEFFTGTLTPAACWRRSRSSPAPRITSRFAC